MVCHSFVKQYPNALDFKLILEIALTFITQHFASTYPFSASASITYFLTPSPSSCFILVLILSLGNVTFRTEQEREEPSAEQ